MVLHVILLNSYFLFCWLLIYPFAIMFNYVMMSEVFANLQSQSIQANHMIIILSVSKYFVPGNCTKTDVAHMIHIFAHIFCSTANYGNWKPPNLYEWTTVNCGTFSIQFTRKFQFPLNLLFMPA